MENYRILEKDEIIQKGDEVEISNSFHDDPLWEPAKAIGEKAPDPRFPAHRMYRRKVINN